MIQKKITLSYLIEYDDESMESGKQIITVGKKDNLHDIFIGLFDSLYNKTVLDAERKTDMDYEYIKEIDITIDQP